jgi:hypothetical protein
VLVLVLVLVGLSVCPLTSNSLPAPTKQAKPKLTQPIPHSAQPTHIPTVTPKPSTTTRRYIRCLGIGTRPTPFPNTPVATSLTLSVPHAGKAQTAQRRWFIH